MSAPAFRDLVVDPGDPRASLLGHPGECREGRCAVCGSQRPTSPTRIARGLPARAVVDGRFAGNPVFDLCPECSRMLNEGRLHLRWSEANSARPKQTGESWDVALFRPARIGGGHWEAYAADRPLPRPEALRRARGWRRLGR